MITRRRAFLGIMSIATLSCAGLASTPAMAADDRLLADILAGITDAVARNYIREHWREGHWDGRRWSCRGRYFTMDEYRDYLVRSAYPPPRRAAPPPPRPAPGPKPGPGKRPGPGRDPGSGNGPGNGPKPGRGPDIARPPAPRPGPAPRPSYAPKPGYAPY